MKKLLQLILYAFLLSGSLFLAPRSSVAAGPPIEQKKEGKVTAIDDKAQTFICVWKNENHTMHTSEKTAYMVGETKGSFSDIKVGEVVTLTCHFVGHDWFVDTCKIAKGP